MHYVCCHSHIGQISPQIFVGIVIHSWVLDAGDGLSYSGYTVL